MSEDVKFPKLRKTDVRCIVRSKVNENGDISEQTELVDPDSFPHPLAGIVYDPATMSLTAQLSAGVELKPVKPGIMYSDPLEAERIALRMNRELGDFAERQASLNKSPEPEPTPEPEPISEPEPQN